MWEIGHWSKSISYLTHCITEVESSNEYILDEETGRRVPKVHVSQMKTFIPPREAMTKGQTPD